MTLLQIILLIGLLGAVFMFLGDMTLYYNKNDYAADGTLNPIINIMKTENRTRLYIGGIMGPVAAFFYCIGYYHLVLFIDDRFAIAGWGCFLVNCLGIICGGAYHSHCANLGLIGRLENAEAMDEVLKYMNAQKLVAFGIQAVGFIALAVFILAGWTTFPRWMAIVTPGVLVMLTPIMRKLPKGFHMIICGGWTNLISVIYYGVALIMMFLR